MFDLKKKQTNPNPKPQQKTKGFVGLFVSICVSILAEDSLIHFKKILETNSMFECLTSIFSAWLFSQLSVNIGAMTGLGKLVCCYGNRCDTTSLCFIARSSAKI